MREREPESADPPPPPFHNQTSFLEIMHRKSEASPPRVLWTRHWKVLQVSSDAPWREGELHPAPRVQTPG